MKMQLEILIKHVGKLRHFARVNLDEASEIAGISKGELSFTFSNRLRDGLEKLKTKLEKKVGKSVSNSIRKSL